MLISFVQTGGTIDKDYPRSTKGYAFEIAGPAYLRLLDRLKPVFQFQSVPVLQKDSMEITAQDRLLLLDTINKLDNDRIIITHGTDTMLDTAQVLAGVVGKTIVITGAMRPERFVDSDAPINLGVAVGAVQVLEPGVYIAMNGLVTRWDLVMRNMESGQFLLA